MFAFVLLSITLCPYYFCNRLEEEEKADSLLLLSYGCIVTINILWLFLTVLWVGLQYVIVVFLDQTHLLFIHFTMPFLCLSFINRLFLLLVWKFNHNNRPGYVLLFQ